MSETLLPYFEWLKELNPIIYVIVIAFVPLIELRGSIIAAGLMQLPPLAALGWSLVGSILPAFVVIPLFSWGLNLLEKLGWFPWLTKWLNKKFVAKAEKVAADQESIATSDKKEWQKELQKFWGIAIFVGIPLPGTGVWTGSAIASIIKMPFPKAFLAVLVGDVIAGLIMTFAVYAVPFLWSLFFAA